MPKLFKLVLDDSMGQVFLPGDEVNGNVVLELAKPKKLLAIQLCLLGWVEVLSETFSAKKQFLEQSTTVWSKPEKEEQGTLPAGLHSLPFSFLLPANAPPSLECEGDSARIKYRIYAKIKTGKYQWSSVTEKRLRVVEIVNSSLPHLQKPAHGVHRSNQLMCLFPTTPNELNVELPRTGYKLGEAMPLTVAVESGGHKLNLTARLIRKASAGIHGAVTVDTENIAKVSLKAGKPEQGSTFLWSPNIDIPSTDPSLKSDIISVSYFVRVTAKSQWRPKLIVEIPVTIGNVV